MVVGLIDCLIDCLADCLICCLICCRSEYSVDGLIAWLIAWRFDCLCVLVSDVLFDWLVECVVLYLSVD